MIAMNEILCCAPAGLWVGSFLCRPYRAFNGYDSIPGALPRAGLLRPFRPEEAIFSKPVPAIANQKSQIANP
jgi:hypothetical protein